VPQLVQQALRQFQQSNKYSMILNEIYQRSPEAYQDLSQDNSQPQLHNLRKTRLTLRQINKLRQMNDVRSYEYKEKLKDIRKQYAPPAQPLV
jgi:ribosomal protein S21